MRHTPSASGGHQIRCPKTTGLGKPSICCNCYFEAGQISRHNKQTKMTAHHLYRYHYKQQQQQQQRRQKSTNEKSPSQRTKRSTKITSILSLLLLSPPSSSAKANPPTSTPFISTTKQTTAPPLGAFVIMLVCVTYCLLVAPTFAIIASKNGDFYHINSLAPEHSQNDILSLGGEETTRPIKYRQAHRFYHDRNHHYHHHHPHDDHHHSQLFQSDDADEQGLQKNHQLEEDEASTRDTVNNLASFKRREDEAGDVDIGANDNIYKSLNPWNYKLRSPSSSSLLDNQVDNFIMNSNVDGNFLADDDDDDDIFNVDDIDSKDLLIDDGDDATRLVTVSGQHHKNLYQLDDGHQRGEDQLGHPDNHFNQHQHHRRRHNHNHPRKQRHHRQNQHHQPDYNTQHRLPLYHHNKNPAMAARDDDDEQTESHRDGRREKEEEEASLNMRRQNPPQVPEQSPIVVSSSDNSYVSASPITVNNEVISTTATTTSSSSSSGGSSVDVDGGGGGGYVGGGGQASIVVEAEPEAGNAALRSDVTVDASSRAHYSNIRGGSASENYNKFRLSSLLPVNYGRGPSYSERQQSHLASIEIEQEEPNNFEKGGLNSAIIAIMFGIAATGMLIVVVGHKMNSIRRRVAYKGRRRSLVPDTSDFVIQTIPI